MCAVWSYPFQVLLQIDACSGFEMETFEFQNILQTDGFPQSVECLTHFSIQNQNALKKINRALKQHFWTEVQQVGSEPTVVWTYVEHILMSGCV